MNFRLPYNIRSELRCIGTLVQIPSPFGDLLFLVSFAAPIVGRVFPTAVSALRFVFRTLAAGTSFMVASTLDTSGWQVTIDRHQTYFTAVVLREATLRFK